jgi:transcriptional regulator with XRE-family HTH domain
MAAIDQYVGARLRERREALGMSAADLAEAIQVTAARITAFEQGWTRIGGRVLVRLSLVLGVRPGFFFSGYDADAANDRRH